VWKYVRGPSSHDSWSLSRTAYIRTLRCSGSGWGDTDWSKVGRYGAGADLAGLYIGADGGFSFASGATANGFVGGAHVGYNYQMGHWTCPSGSFSGKASASRPSHRLDLLRSRQPTAARFTQSPDLRRCVSLGQNGERVPGADIRSMIELKPTRCQCQRRELDC